MNNYKLAPGQAWTKREALQLLLEEYRALAIENAQKCIGRQIDYNDVLPTLDLVLPGSFIFDETPQGATFWHTLRSSLKSAPILLHTK